MKTTLKGFALAALLAAAGAAPARGAVRVVTTITDLADLTRVIGGDRVSVEAIAKGTQDPHYLQAKPSYLVALHRADLFIVVGLELEVGYVPLLIQGARNPAIVPGKPGYLEASRDIPVIGRPTGPVSRAQGDVHPQGNPHYWLDPENAKIIAAEIAGALSTVDPEGRKVFEANLKGFDAEIDRRMEGWKAKLAPFAGTPIVTYHQEFDYFAKRFGLVMLDYVEDRPGIPPSAPHLADLAEEMRAKKVRVILTSPYYENQPGERVAEETGAKLLELPTSVGGADRTDHYVDVIDRIVAALVAALAGGSQ